MFQFNKKAMGTKTIASIILLLAASITLFATSSNLLWNTKALFDEEACRASIWGNVNLALKIPLGGKYTPIKPQCPTAERVVPEDEKGKTFEKSYQGAMDNIGYLAAKCWWMFGEGFYRAKDIDGFESSNGGLNRPCHICYTFVIDNDVLDNVGKSYIDGNDLDVNFDTALFDVQPEWHEHDCSNFIDDDGDKFVDMDDPDCQDEDKHENVYSTSCGARGGYCQNNCNEPNEYFYGMLKEYDKSGWECWKEDTTLRRKEGLNEDNLQKCCVPSYIAPTYREYIEQNRNAPGILYLGRDESGDRIDLGLMESSKPTEYAIAFVMPQSRLFSDNDDISETDLYHIIIEEKSKLAMYCDISDISVN